MNRYQKGSLLLGLYLASIVIAAALVIYIGPVPVGFGLYAPAGAYAIGFTLVFRDLAQDQLGPAWTYAAILVGTIITAAMSPSVALAAATAFITSETIDLLVYTPIRKRGHLKTAMLLSNTVSIAVDSAIFLTIAFGNLEFFWGQVWAKLAATFLAIIALKIVYRNRTDMTPIYIQARNAQPQ